MLNDKKILGIIPARGGSKGVERKNIKLLHHKPLIAWTIESALKSTYLDKLIVSTDCAEIATVAKQFGADVPFVRPKNLAKDDTPGIDPILHAMSLFPEFDYVVMLQPTSPLRSTQDIDECIETCIQNNHPVCVTVVESEKTPYWMYQIDKEKILQPVLPDKNILRRQDAPMVYVLNGAVYIGEYEFIKNHKSFLTNETAGHIMPKERSFDIDSLFDFELVEWIINKN